MGTPATIGVLALQGAFARHVGAFEQLGADCVEVRRSAHLDVVDALVLPGGESGTMSMLLDRAELFDPIADRLAEGMPALGTCAGMILLGREILDGRPDQRCFEAIDIVTRRNAYGRQLDSFEIALDLSSMGAGFDTPFDASFIRAPAVEKVGDDVDVLARVDDRPVLCSSGPVMVAAFHPELPGADGTSDLRIHRYFLEEVT
ncbi:MAG: pyridoxal 5'-phosphate synthase glutaminase subunit PdxT [Acidimicrobiales bacterium]|nr:pyridoxal 5'-phosphate synthase glutaminase subunit PdxT [Acidimicrobiales bacterium]